MKLYSYIITHDTGFAPNPFWGCCTLANCKPAIRRTAEVGDWIIGLSPRANGNRVVFTMKVDAILDYASYYRDPRFSKKIPDYTKGKVIYKCGDNIYKPLPDGGFLQLRSMHSNGEQENPETKAHDLGGKKILIGKVFYYFGNTGHCLPNGLDDLKVGRGHKSRHSQKVISDFLIFISLFPKGVNAPPTHWPADDTSWNQVGE